MAQATLETVPGQRCFKRRTAESPVYRCPRQRGFTLVELLVVVSIIALLISILLPSLKQAREQAKTIKCLAHGRGMGQAGASFANDHNGRFQLVANDGGGGIGVSAIDSSRNTYEYDSEREILAWPVSLARASGIDIKANWQWAIRRNTFSDALAVQDKMSKEFEMFTCPSDRVKIATPFYPNGMSMRGNGDPQDPMAPGDGLMYWGLLSFGINEDIVGTEAKMHPSGVPWPAAWKNNAQGESIRGNWADAGRRLRGNMDRIFDPGTCLLIVDAGANTKEEALAKPFDNSKKDGYANLITSAQARGPTLENSVATWLQRIPTTRHPKGAVNITFADFHAASVKVVEWNEDGATGIRYPQKYESRVRVSPYKPLPPPGL